MQIGQNGAYCKELLKVLEDLRYLNDWCVNFSKKN